MSSASNRRREGREAFSPGDDPATLCPYKSVFKAQNWYDGWSKAEEEHNKNVLDIANNNQDWESIRYDCPWYDFDNYWCTATNKTCEKENCAPWVFVTKFAEIR